MPEIADFQLGHQHMFIFDFKSQSKCQPDMDEKLNKHYVEFDAYLKKAKKDFDIRWRREFHENACISDFKFLQTLGTGSFGRVVLVKHRAEGDKPYALKMLEKQHIVKTKQVKHTLSEIRIMDAFNFTFLITLEFFFKDNVYLCIVMPFINGGEMFSHLRSLRKFDENLTKFYAAQVILSFEYMHYLGIVYRDLKPENILLDKDGFLKLTDYGFCKKIDDQRTYTLCGTPEYLAPEIILSQGYNKSVDWWALGVLMYEMAAGYPPFYARDPMKIYEKIVTGKYMSPPHFSRALKDLILNILQVDRSKRFGLLKNGARDVKNHDFFKGFDWDALLKRTCSVPYKPKVSNDCDTSNFDRYEEQPLKTSSQDQFQREFAVIVV